MSEYKATIKWQRTSPDFLKGKYSREHTWTFDGGVTVPASSSPPLCPRPGRIRPALIPKRLLWRRFRAATCSRFFIWPPKPGFQIDSYEDEAVGEVTKNEKGVPWVSLVTLNPMIVYGGEKLPTPADEERLHHLAHEQCYIANSVKTEVLLGGMVTLAGTSNDQMGTLQNSLDRHSERRAPSRRVGESSVRAETVLDAPVLRSF